MIEYVITNSNSQKSYKCGFFSLLPLGLKTESVFFGSNFSHFAYDDLKLLNDFRLSFSNKLSPKDLLGDRLKEKPNGKIYIDKDVKIPRHQISKTFSLVRDIKKADMICVPNIKQVVTEYLNRYVFIKDDKCFVVSMSDSVINSAPFKLNIGFEFRFLGMNEIIRESSPWKEDFLSQLFSSKCVYIGPIYLISKRDLSLMKILSGEYQNVIQEKDLLLSIGNDITEERIDSLYHMLQSTDKTVVLAALRIISELNYMKYKTTLHHILHETNYKWKHLILPTSVKVMLNNIEAKYSSSYPSKPESKDDADIFKKYLVEMIEHDLANISDRYCDVCDIDLNYSIKMKYKKDTND